jgi:hypothetical protein
MYPATNRSLWVHMAHEASSRATSAWLHAWATASTLALKHRYTPPLKTPHVAKQQVILHRAFLRCHSQSTLAVQGRGR